jgi:hypothetical protein
MNAGNDGQLFLLAITQGTGGNFSISWGSGTDFGSDIPSVTLSTTAGLIDYIGMCYNATTSNWKIIGYARGY